MARSTQTAVSKKAAAKMKRLIDEKNGNIITGITRSGFEFTIDREVLDDYELLELIAELDENPLVFTKVLKYLLGDEQVQELKALIKERDGRVSATAMTQEIEDIFKESAVKK